MASRWPHLAGPAFVVHDFAIGEIAPLDQSRTICRFRTLPLDRQLRCSCVATAEEVELNSYPVCERACADVSALSVDARLFGRKRIDMRDRRSGPHTP